MKTLLVMVALLGSFAPALASAATIPVRVRILKGSRQGPPAVDPKLADLQSQLGKLAYVRWDQIGEHRADMDFGKAASFPLPDGAALELTLVDSRKDTVTFEVKVAGRARSRLTIAKDQRIVHQVADEKNGEAYFASVRPWP
ncbi:MAG TPA: hypothetical protein VFP65_22620 [Anaeromyxobacteraceae bacterium]|nr:hypothetical protein [Anaeromyxobacteraceae bacterium]